MARLRRLRTARVTVLTVCALALAGLFAAVIRQSMQTNSDAATIVRQESYGAEMLHTMTTLLSTMVQAQSAAVRGESVDSASLRTALAGVAAVDKTRGDALQTHQRLNDLTKQVEAVLSLSPTGQSAYDSYTDLVTLTLDLDQQIGDNSHLVHDPELDSFYVMEAAIIRLPNAVVLAGRASDLVALAGGKALQGEDAIRAAVARFGVSEAAEAVNSGLTRSVDTTARTELGSNIAPRLDTFKAAADAFAPPTVLDDLAGAVDSATLSANARRVYAAATPLAHLLLGELQALLASRTAKLTNQWRLTAFAGVGVAVIGVVVIWLAIAGRRRASELDGSGEASVAYTRGDRPSVGSLSYARDVLDADGLVGSGTSARTRSAKQQAWGDGDAR